MVARLSGGETSVNEKEMHHPDPQLSTYMNLPGDGLEIQISAKALARFVSLCLSEKKHHIQQQFLRITGWSDYSDYVSDARLLFIKTSPSDLASPLACQYNSCSVKND